jgi:hypothetical protein
VILAAIQSEDGECFSWKWRGVGGTGVEGVKKIW